jgi:hypothetical protein
MSQPKIVTYRGPTHRKANGWIAYDEDTYDGASDAHGSCRCLGLGDSEEEAIADLREQLAEWEETR